MDTLHFLIITCRSPLVKGCGPTSLIGSDCVMIGAHKVTLVQFYLENAEIQCDVGSYVVELLSSGMVVPPVGIVPRSTNLVK